MPPAVRRSAQSLAWSPPQKKKQLLPSEEPDTAEEPDAESSESSENSPWEAKIFKLQKDLGLGWIKTLPLIEGNMRERCPLVLETPKWKKARKALHRIVNGNEDRKIPGIASLIEFFNRRKASKHRVPLDETDFERFEKKLVSLHKKAQAIGEKMTKDICKIQNRYRFSLKLNKVMERAKPSYRPRYRVSPQMKKMKKGFVNRMMGWLKKVNLKKFLTVAALAGMATSGAFTSSSQSAQTGLGNVNVMNQMLYPGSSYTTALKQDFVPWAAHNSTNKDQNLNDMPAKQNRTAEENTFSDNQFEDEEVDHDDMPTKQEKSAEGDILYEGEEDIDEIINLDEVTAEEADKTSDDTPQYQYATAKKTTSSDDTPYPRSSGTAKKTTIYESNKTTEMHWQDNSKYVGKMHPITKKRHGKGVYTDSKGNQFVETWDNDKLISSVPKNESAEEKKQEEMREENPDAGAKLNFDDEGFLLDEEGKRIPPHKIPEEHAQHRKYIWPKQLPDKHGFPLDAKGNRIRYDFLPEVFRNEKSKIGETIKRKCSWKPGFFNYLTYGRNAFKSEKEQKEFCNNIDFDDLTIKNDANVFPGHYVTRLYKDFPGFEERYAERVAIEESMSDHVKIRPEKPENQVPENNPDGREPGYVVENGEWVKKEN